MESLFFWPITCLNSHELEILQCQFHIKILFPSLFSFISYKHSDENPVTCNGPPVEIPGEYTDKLNVTYTYSVRLK